MKLSPALLSSLITVAALFPSIGNAATVEKWQGSGSEYSPDGKELGAYQITVVNTEKAPHVVQSETTIVTANGEQKVISQTLTFNGKQWRDDSTLGKGGGACYGEDLCENYIAGADGLAFATTIVADGANNRRQLTMVLKNGVAVKVLREKIARLN